MPLSVFSESCGPQCPALLLIQNPSNCLCAHCHQSPLMFPALQLSEILKFGVDKLLSSEESSVQDVKLEQILGPSRDGQWVADEDFTSLKKEVEEEESISDSDGQSRFISQTGYSGMHWKNLTFTFCYHRVRNWITRENTPEISSLSFQTS